MAVTLAEPLAERILAGLDVGPLLEQLTMAEHLWQKTSVWVKARPDGGYVPDNIVLRYNYPDRHWMEWWHGEALAALPAAADLLAALLGEVPGEILGKVGLTRMWPGECLDWHVDSARPFVYERYQIAIQAPAGAEFQIEDWTVPMAAGEAWWFDKARTHRVVLAQGASALPRIAMVVEIRPLLAAVQ